MVEIKVTRRGLLIITHPRRHLYRSWYGIDIYRSTWDDWCAYLVVRGRTIWLKNH